LTIKAILLLFLLGNSFVFSTMNKINKKINKRGLGDESTFSPLDFIVGFLNESGIPVISYMASEMELLMKASENEGNYIKENDKDTAFKCNGKGLRGYYDEKYKGYEDKAQEKLRQSTDSLLQLAQHFDIITPITNKADLKNLCILIKEKANSEPEPSGLTSKMKEAFEDNTKVSESINAYLMLPPKSTLPCGICFAHTGFTYRRWLVNRFENLGRDAIATDDHSPGSYQNQGWIPTLEQNIVNAISDESIRSWLGTKRTVGKMNCRDMRTMEDEKKKVFVKRVLAGWDTLKVAVPCTGKSLGFAVATEIAWKIVEVILDIFTGAIWRLIKVAVYVVKALWYLGWALDAQNDEKWKEMSLLYGKAAGNAFHVFTTLFPIPGLSKKRKLLKRK